MTQPGPSPSAHALSLAGVDLPGEVPPLVRVEMVRETVVVLSRSRTVGREVHVDRCRADGVPIVVRPSGGGAVVLAPGVVAASVLAVAPAPSFPEPHFRRFCGVVADALQGYGIGRVTLRGVSDLCVGDRKIAGSALRLFGDTVLFQISVLVDLDVALIERYLPQPSRQPDYRNHRSHRDFVTTLRQAGAAVTAAEVAAALKAALDREVAAR